MISLKKFETLRLILGAEDEAGKLWWVNKYQPWVHDNTITLSELWILIWFVVVYAGNVDVYPMKFQNRMKRVVQTIPSCILVCCAWPLTKWIEDD